MIGTCPSCGVKTGGIMRQCAGCKRDKTYLANLDSKIPHRPVGGGEDDE